MTPEEQRAIEAYKAAGVDVSDLEQAPEAQTPTEEKKPEEQKPAPETTEKEEESKEEPEKKDVTNPKPERKNRSIYDDLKSEREKRKETERENAELKRLLEQSKVATTTEAKQEAADDLEAFAKEIGADPQAIKRMRDLFLKDFTPAQPDESLRKSIEEFQEWRQANQSAIEAQHFEQEFAKATPTLKSLFPTASAEEMSAIKSELDRISHTEGWHDKELDYVAFKNQVALSVLVSPKKRGMESKGRKDVEEQSNDFDPNADLASMSPKQRMEWEAEYRRLSGTPGITKDTAGRSLIL